MRVTNEQSSKIHEARGVLLYLNLEELYQHILQRHEDGKAHNPVKRPRHWGGDISTT